MLSQSRLQVTPTECSVICPLTRFFKVFNSLILSVCFCRLTFSQRCANAGPELLPLGNIAFCKTKIVVSVLPFQVHLNLSVFSEPTFRKFTTLPALAWESSRGLETPAWSALDRGPVPMEFMPSGLSVPGAFGVMGPGFQPHLCAVVT